MRLVIADTTPVNYLILIGHIDLLRSLFGKVILPVAVRLELASYRAPGVVKEWIAQPPDWIEVRDTPSLPDDPSLLGIDAGETAAIQLALLLQADLLLMDDRKAVKIARSKGFRVTGTLGILELAAESGLIDLAEAANRLRGTTFRSPEGLIDAMVRKHAKGGGVA